MATLDQLRKRYAFPVDRSGEVLFPDFALGQYTTMFDLVSVGQIIHKKYRDIRVIDARLKAGPFAGQRLTDIAKKQPAYLRDIHPKVGPRARALIEKILGESAEEIADKAE